MTRYQAIINPVFTSKEVVRKREMDEMDERKYYVGSRSVEQKEECLAGHIFDLTWANIAGRQGDSNAEGPL